MESEEKKKSNTIVLTFAFARVIEPRKIQISSFFLTICVRERRSLVHARAGATLPFRIINFSLTNPTEIAYDAHSVACQSHFVVLSTSRARLLISKFHSPRNNDRSDVEKGFVRKYDVCASAWRKQKCGWLIFCVFLFFVSLNIDYEYELWFSEEALNAHRQITYRCAFPLALYIYIYISLFLIYIPLL